MAGPGWQVPGSPGPGAPGWQSPGAGGPSAPPPGYGWAPHPGAGGAPAVRWSGTRGLRTALIVLFCLAGLSALGVIGAVVNRRSVAHDVLTSNESALRGLLRLEDADDAVGATVALWLLVVVATAVLVIIWSFRSARNTQALGRTGQAWKPGWAIGGWFIPVANWVIPFLVLQEVWQASDPRAGADWRRGPKLALVWAWMGTWIATGVLGFLDRDIDFTDDVDALLDRVDRQAVLLTVWMAASIAAAVLAMLSVHRITSRQEAARAALALGGPAAAPGGYPPAPPGAFTPPPPPPPPPGH